VGTNPRDTKQRTEAGGKGENIKYLRKAFYDCGWEVLEGPSPGWQLQVS
jgi:hypothetical protein